MRKVGLILMALLAGGMLFANGQQDAAGSGETIEVDIFQFKVEIVDELEMAAEMYEAEHPGVKINVETVGGGNSYDAALRVKFQGGNEPTIFNVKGPSVVEEWKHTLEDLSDQSWVDLALPGVLDGVNADDKIFGLPFNIEGYGFVYNKRIFEAAGIDAKSITSYDALERAMATLDRKIKGGELKEEFPLLEAVVSFPGKETWVYASHLSNIPLAGEFDHIMKAYEAKSIDFTYANEYKKLIDLQIQYSPFADNPALLNAVDYATQTEGGLAIERVAMIQQGNWVYNGVDKIDSEVAVNLDILPLPLIGVNEKSIPVGVPNNWCVNSGKSEAEKAVAKDFLNWLYTSDEGKHLIINEFYFIPPFRGYEGMEPVDSLGQAIKRYAEAGDITPWVKQAYPSGWYKEMGVDMQAYIAGEMEWDAIIEKATQRWQDMRS